MLSLTGINTAQSRHYVCLNVSTAALLSGQGGDQHSQPFPRREEQTQLESHPGCFYYRIVNGSLSVLNTEGKLLLPLICDIDITWVAVARIG